MVLMAGSALRAQTPKPFPQPESAVANPHAGASPRAAARTGAPHAAPAAADVPTEATLGVPIYPGAQFITSYDAGRGPALLPLRGRRAVRRIVTFYRTALKQKGDELFESPPTHQFETGRFREETMAFPPSVTIKDYTWGGSAGYPNPKQGSRSASRRSSRSCRRRREPRRHPDQ